MVSRRALKMPKIAATLDSMEPKEPFWHLAWVGVDSDMQRRGVGSALADEAVRMMKAEQAPGWLATFGPHTRRIYESRGFVVEQEFRPFPEGPTGWTLRRDDSSEAS